MNRRNFFLSMVGTVASLVLPGCGKAPRSAPDTGAATASPSDESQRIAYEKQSQALLDAAAQRETEQQRMGEAEARTGEYRARVQYVAANPWSKFINEHTTVFRMLRQEASQSRTKTVRCTICDGRGQLKFCVACADTGKCPTCKGTGRLQAGEICPSCQGNRKCFLCHGAGKMACPFCDDGSVYANQPDPPAQIPI